VREMPNFSASTDDAAIVDVSRFVFEIIFHIGCFSFNLQRYNKKFI
jgi:hypothetical protein